MADLKPIDHAVQDGQISTAAEDTGPGGMTNGVRSAVGKLAAMDVTKGAKIHMFNPDATPEEKAAEKAQAKASLGLPSSATIKATLGQVGSYVPGVTKKEDLDLGGRAVTIDTSTSKSAPIPTVSLADVDKASKAENEGAGDQNIPGSIPTGAAPPVPTWVKTGWRQVAGLGKDDKTAEESNILAAYLTENMYGAWFHNAGIILFAILMTRFVTVLHLGWGWVVIILAFCASYYSLSITRTRQRARDDIQRELVKTRLVTETESAEWMNSFLERFWLIYEPVLSQTIIASTDAALAGVAPAGVESIRLTTFTLGTKAPRIDYVRTFPKTPEDIVIMDWALSFTPNDLQDVTPRQAAKRVNPKIVLSIRIGKGAVSKGIPILLEDMSFTGKMRIKLKLMTNFPHIQTVDMSFIEKPTFDYVLKPIGGETFGFDINNIPGLAPFIRDQVHANLGPMMYDPNVFTIDLQQLLSGTPLDAAIGVLRVTVLDARGLKATKFGGGDPDPYAAIALGAKPAVAHTKTIPSTSNPSWHETHFILLNSLADVLNFNIFDYNDHRPDNLLGTVSHELGTLDEEAEQEGVVGKILGGGKDRGEFRYDLSYFPVLKPEKKPDGTFEPLPETHTGIVRLTLHQAKDLDISKMYGNLSPFAKVYLGNSRKEVHKTQILKNSNQPIWESSCEFLVPEKKNSVITISIVDSRDLAVDGDLGKVTVKLTDLLEARARQQDWFPLKGSRAGKLRLTADWKPVAMTGSLAGAAAYVPPIGILRIWLKKALDVKNVEAALGGKSDPYVRVMGNNRVLARTEVQNNNLNPEWDQIVYVPIHSLRENLILELMDYQNIGKDRTLGYVEIKASEFAEADPDDIQYPYISKGPQIRKDRIKLEKHNQYKGELLYEVDFKPAVSIRGGVSFEAQKNEFELAAEEALSQNGDGDAQESIITDNIVDDSTIASTSSPLAKPLNGLGHRPSGSLGGNGRPSVNGHRPSHSIGNASMISAVTAQSTLSKADSRINGDEPLTPVEDVEQGVELTMEDILSSSSGVLVFQVISGQLAKKGSLEVMFDDGYWPSFTSGKARSHHPTWDQVGEGFIRELDMSRTWLSINASDENDDEDIVAEFKCNTIEFLEQCIRAPSDFLLCQADGSNRSTVRLAARFVPVDIKLEPRESCNNQGVLRVDVISAKGLHGADRSGKSDPYVVFYLNGMKTFKSDTKRKTLSPVWDESFEVVIPSRVAAKFKFEINDWDRVGSATPIGSGFINLADLEPFESTDMTLPVVSEKHGEKGTLSIRVMFQPEIIARTRQKTSTFSQAGRVVTTIGGVPLGVGKGVVHGGGAVIGGVGHGIGAVGGFAGRRVGLLKKKDKSGSGVITEQPELAATVGDGGLGYDLPAGQVSEPVNSGFEGSSISNSGVPVPKATTLPIGEGNIPTEPGTLGVTVLGAKDLKAGAKPYVQIRLGGKTHKTDHVKSATPEWDETFNFNVAPGTTTFSLTVYDHHTLGKDIEIGSAEVDIFRHIQPAVPNADVWVELEGLGNGLIRLRLDWNTGVASTSSTSKLRNRTPSISSSKAANEEKHSSPSKFSMKSIRKPSVDKHPQDE